MTESRTLACSSGRDMFLRGSNAAMLYVLRDRERAHIYGFLMGLLCEGSLRFWVWGSTMLISVFRCAVFSATAAPATLRHSTQVAVVRRVLGGALL